MWPFGKKAPPLCPGNPGTGDKVQVGFARDGESWTEEADLVALAASVLEEQGHAIQRERSWIVHPQSGFVITPRLALVQPLEEGGVHTVSTVQVNHPRLAPEGVFEYQHATGERLEESFSDGFSKWAQLDLVTLLDSLQPKPKDCTVMEMSFPAKEGRPALKRRAVLGPVTYLQQHPPSPAASGEACETHSFCPCCLLTSSFVAFRELVESDQFYCLRLFAQREEDGTLGADCRVNGQDWEAGAEALRAYARSWPPAGFEFRKQLVVLQNLDS